MRLSKKEKSWVLYDWANSAYTLIVTSTIFQLYFKMITDQVGVDKSLSTAYWGYTNALATLILAIIAPVLGTIADYKGYKKKFFVLFFGMGVFFTTILPWLPEQSWLLLLILYNFTAIGFSGANVFYDAFLIDITSEERMDYVSTSGFAWGYIGSTIPFILSMTLVVLSQLAIIPLTLTATYKMAFIITAIWWTVFTLPMIKNVTQVYGIEVEEQLIRKSFKRLGRTLKDIKKHKPLFLFLLAYFFYIDGVDTIIKMATSYGSDLGIDAMSLLIILLATQFIAFPFAILYGWLAKKFSGKAMLYVGICIYTLICVYAYFMTTTLDFWILAFLVGTSQGGIQALSRSYYGKLVPKDKANEFFGFYNIFGKFAAIMGPLLMGIVTQLTGRTQNGIFSLIALFVIGGLLLSRVPSVNIKENPSL